MAAPRTGFTVLGAGSWGTALAAQLARAGHAVTLWARDPEHVARMAASHTNPRYLPDVALPPTLTFEADLELAVQAGRDLLVCVPSAHFSGLVQRITPLLSAQQRLLWATKGLEPDSRRLLHEVVAEAVGASRPTAVLSGPTFAGEVARGMATAVTIASHHADYAAELAHAFSDQYFRAYTSDDMVGVQLGGAVKNVLAIAAGVADGLGLGANSRAALVTRGLAEMMRLGERMGGQATTFMGLAGLGDLVLTCTDDQSRNRRFGLALGRGASVAEARASIDQVVEGAETVREVHALATEHAVEMPITEQVFAVLYQGVSPQAAAHALLARELKPEVYP